MAIKKNTAGRKISSRNLVILIILLGFGVFAGFRGLKQREAPPTRNEKILRTVGLIIEAAHYSPKDFDDSFSRVIFKKYLGEIDPEKDIFLQSDVDTLRAKYETAIDDEILGKTGVQFVPAVVDLLKKRLPETEALYKEILATPFEFSSDETIDLNQDSKIFPASAEARKEAWRKRLKYLALGRYSELIEQQEASKGKAGYTAKTDAELEKEAREKVTKSMGLYYDRLHSKANNEDDKFTIFVETIVQYMDPHTNYFPPVDKRYFDEQMRGTFFGIGATLREEDGNIKIATLVTGSPAWKSGQVNTGDFVLRVGQGSQESVDLTGFTTQDAVKLIRGTKGTEVRLTLKKSDGTVKVVALIRDQIVQDETFARSVIINSGKKKVGYIYLPEFYADFEHEDGHRCSVDVGREVSKLKEQQVDGIVIDLRYNPGGSLYEVVQMAGLFIDQGPVVQVKDRQGKVQVMSDNDKNVLYDGPLSVLVNEYSASASEIFAAAIQDYKRGVVIGGTSTYGKGTVQRPIGLDKSSGLIATDSSLGTVELTFQKFYRVNGGSTQLHGVAADILLPDYYEYSKVREKDNPDALPWDEIQKASYQPWKYAYDDNVLKNASAERLKSNSAFNTINTDAQLVAKQNDKQYPLNLQKFREAQKQVKAAVTEIGVVSKLPADKELSISSIPSDTMKLAADKGKADRYHQWINILKKDIYLNETVNIMNDMVDRKSVAYKQ